MSVDYRDDWNQVWVDTPNAESERGYLEQMALLNMVKFYVLKEFPPCSSDKDRLLAVVNDLLESKYRDKQRGAIFQASPLVLYGRNKNSTVG